MQEMFIFISIIEDLYKKRFSQCEQQDLTVVQTARSVDYSGLDDNQATIYFLDIVLKCSVLLWPMKAASTLQPCFSTGYLRN